MNVKKLALIASLAGSLSGCISYEGGAITPLALAPFIPAPAAVAPAIAAPIIVTSAPQSWWWNSCSYQNSR
ncbi:MAG: hypothetical protein IKS41_03940 [Alphaproteobacteria bacterium]|nr:hypothetical protein [Alphaproteobacteria bacterium]